MKYLIIGLNFLVENPQSPMENTIPPCDSGPAPQENKVSAPPFLRMLQKFLGLPCRKGAGGGGGGGRTLWPH